MHHQECILPYADISLQSGRFWVTLIASSMERLLDFRSCWIVFIHEVQWCPGGLLQFSEEEAVKIFLASVSSGICRMRPKMEKCRAWTIVERCGCLVVRLTLSFHTWWYHLIPNSFCKHHCHPRDNNNNNNNNNIRRRRLSAELTSQLQVIQ